jgi:predicted alpha/beta superfamily hydrolase
MNLAAQAKVEHFDLPHPSGSGSFRISVSRVAGLPEGAKDVPVLYVLDGDTNFGLAAEIARLRGTGGLQPTAMVVGIGYGVVDFMEFAKLRTADLTPPLSEAGKAALGALASVVGDQDGGADAFVNFLADALAPAIAERYPEASATDRSLFGHSLGGLFAVYALLTRPDAFKTFLPASPSLWWDGFAVLGHLPGFKEKLATLARKPRVLISVGGKEQDIPTKVPPGLAVSLEEAQALVAHSRMVDAAVEFAGTLRDAGLSDTVGIVFDGEDHSSVIPAALSRALGFAVPLPE